MLKVTNTLTGKKEEFKSLVPGKVEMYVCGVTPYAQSHVGHGRCYVSFDLLYRFLKFLGYDVTYCRNFTDIDDKLLNKAETLLGDKYRYNEIADECIKSFHHDMEQLHCLPPQYEPRVTEHMDTIIAFIEGLIKKGYAYQSNGDVYFSVKSFPGYGKLSKQKIDELRAGARIDVSEKKKDPLDFALWKAEDVGEFWQSPWGWGRPGWHIECSALGDKFLGEQIDIHGGGVDLIFPHHENEIAQSDALCPKQFVRYWMHNGLVNIDKEKMSKSLGNVYTIQEILKKYDPMVIRYYFLNHNYRMPLDFSFDDIDAFQKSYQKLCRAFAPYKVGDYTSEQLKQSPVVQKMVSFLLDDLNTVGMFGVLFEHLSEVSKDEKQAPLIKTFLHNVLGLTLEPLPEKEVQFTPEIKKLIEEREQARKEKNWAKADAIRDQLEQLGVNVQDKKTTT